MQIKLNGNEVISDVISKEVSVIIIGPGVQGRYKLRILVPVEEKPLNKSI